MVSHPRIDGIDVARGLAVLGMFAAHLGNPEQWLPWSRMLEAADGRSAAGFALLAGVSAALISGGAQPVTAARMRRARVRILVRAALLWPLGAAMIALGTPVVVILPTYTLLFAAAAGLIGLRPRTLLAIAAGVLAFAPPAMLLAQDRLAADPPQVLDILVGRYYPAVVWIAYLLVGLAVGRMDLRDPATPRRLLAWGVPTAVAGLAASAIALRTLDPSHTFRRALLTAEPHSSSGVEVLANIGTVLITLGACLWFAHRFPRTTAPLAATGALALTAYCGQLVAIAVMGPSVVYDTDNLTLAAFVVVTLAATTLWRRLLGRGPLERLLHGVSTAVADAVVPAGRAAAPPDAG